MIIKELISYLEEIAPIAYQESYDNAGLIIGNADQNISGVLICLDSIEEVVDEAIANKCNLIIAHHPIVFSGLKKINGKNYVERTIIKAIKHDIAIYALHTNLDNVYHGVNAMIASKLQLQQINILVPKNKLLKKLATFCPEDKATEVRNALFEAGAGHIGGYNECSFNTSGIGTFKASENTNPYLGRVGERHHEKEIKIELVFPAIIESKLVNALKKVHPYEEPAYDLYPIDNNHNLIGAGITGELAEVIDELDFLKSLKKIFKVGFIKHTALLNKKIKKVAVCGGSGSFLLQDAIKQSADIFITSDFKYHQFFDADNKIVIADIGHYETEQYTKELIYELITRKFTKFAVRLSTINTNPVNYL